MTRKPYNQDEFVGREKEIAEIMQWLNGFQKQLLSVVGAPGTGKTWLLAHIMNLLHKPGYRVLVLRKELGDRDEKLADLVRQAAAGYEQIQPFNPQEAPIDNLVDDLCLYNQGNPIPILFVDGLEEMSRPERDWLEYQVLVPFLSRDCTRVLLTRRDYRALSAFRLKRHERILTLDVFPNADSQRQLARLCIELAIDDELLATLQQHLQPYQFGHPLLNSSLMTRHMAKQEENQKEQIGVKDIEACLKHLVGVDLEETHLVTLVQVVKGGPPAVQLRLQDENIQHLFDCGLIQQVPGGPFRVVATGVAELILVWDRLRGGIDNQPTGREAA